MADFVLGLLILAFGLMALVVFGYLVFLFICGLLPFWPVILGVGIVGWFIAWHDDGPISQGVNDE